MSKQYVLIVAGGKGLRMGNELPKQFIPLEGRPILMHTLERFNQWDASADLLLVLPCEHRSYWEMLCRELNCIIPHRIADGGETRFQSVQNGLALVDEPGLVAVHDGVRPFVSAEVITACFEEAEQNGAAIPVVPMIDSIREQYAEGKSRPVDRRRYLAVQTPQVFRSSLVKEAYRQPYTPAFTDDASVVEALGVEIHTVAGNRENIKITDPLDLLMAEALLRKTL
ncbi:2-C-methyl-D-erythritol 4-phosphate cytidylyltransferase [Bacteroidia bacterium]|nr:2-C-methyl-D-erythritol 4-phosphate cytidylyltransferase [Bacteroidia bacterium]GHU54843.1 2-C-methyl-D-erythritol 4-phosphate cytidylyltransferase [Bacteroidia bacterium]